MECIEASTLRSMGSGRALLSIASADRLSWRPRSLPLIRYPTTSNPFSLHHRCTSILHPICHLHRGHSACAAAVTLVEETSSLLEGDHSSDTGEDGEPEELNSRKLGSDELMSLLADSERAKLTKKLSDANQYNRFLKRQLQMRDEALATFKTKLALLEVEIQELVRLAEDVANCTMRVDSRKIIGKEIQSSLLSKLEVVHEKVKEQVMDVGPLEFKDVTVFWIGMAECVQVMGSFDGWSQGEEMSPEYSGGYVTFAVTLKLRPGRYEIKFLVDGEWQLSPEFPTVGEGMKENNLLIVD